ncbi:hypothetical protein L218DRAFT_854857 [Marasmius fiardii PR-910]|nr:hypothetical protein L218DRAFT_854857 [Marasmius fiardii PR-910]
MIERKPLQLNRSTGCHAKILHERVIIRVGKNDPSNNGNSLDILSTADDPMLLAVFGNRFMSIAEQMGYTLQPISISVSTYQSNARILLVLVKR